MWREFLAQDFASIGSERRNGLRTHTGSHLESEAFWLNCLNGNPPSCERQRGCWLNRDSLDLLGAALKIASHLSRRPIPREFSLIPLYCQPHWHPRRKLSDLVECSARKACRDGTANCLRRISTSSARVILAQELNASPAVENRMLIQDHRSDRATTDRRAPQQSSVKWRGPSPDPSLWW